VKVLFVTGEFPPMQGGVGDYTRELGLALAQQGGTVQVVTSAAAGPVAGLTVYPRLDAWGWRSWPTLLALVRRERPDVVHVQYQAAAYGMHPAINLLPRCLRLLGAGRPRLAVTFHDLKVPYLFPKAGSLRRWAVEELARGSDAAITTNREDYETLSAALVPSGPAVSLIPIGSNLAPRLPAGYRREDWRARWGAAPGDLLLCFFGFVNDRKGVDTLLQALRLLLEAEGGTVSPRLVMIGGQTGASDPTNVAYLTRIQATIAELGLSERVRWTGYLPGEEVSACFACSDLCVLPFRDGVSFLHGTFHAALAHGAAIVTTRPRVPLPELEDGENVCTVPPEEPELLAQAIVRLAADPGLRHKLGEGACRLAQQFTWEAIASSTLELYHSLLPGA
jgi:glycosyltransferase involved in cell wall biosynthesis